jgi:DNA end-binding protein Ku
MSARPIATSTISFGLVSLPVKLYSTAESSSRVSFNWLNKDTGNRVKQQYIDPSNNEVVPRDEMVKGYEFAKGQYVTFEPEELKALEAQSTNAIEITEFVPADEIDRMYYSKGYFLGPDKGGARAYRLLAAALRETGRVAIAKYGARGKMYLVMLRPMDGGLLMEQMYYPEELRSMSDVPLEDGDVDDSELKLAVQLIDQASSDSFDPDAYHDEVKDRVLELIQKKVEGEEITIAHEEEPETKIIDLMEALKASLAEGGEATERKPPARAGKKKASRGKSSERKASAG